MIAKIFNISMFSLLFTLVNCCSVTENEFNSDSEALLHELEYNHFQKMTVSSLKEILAGNKFNERDKDFIKYYILSYVDDPSLTNYLKNEKPLKKKENVYSLLLELKETKVWDTLTAISLLNKAKTMEPENIYVIMEQYERAENYNDKMNYLKLATKITPNHELVLTSNIIEYRLNNDSLNYFKCFAELKGKYNNYYTYFFLANEFVFQNRPDSAIIYLSKSLKKKETIGAYIRLSDIYFSFYKDIPLAKKYIQKALDIDANDEEALTMIGWQYHGIKDSANSRMTFEKLILKHPNVQNYKELLMFYFCTNQMDNAKNIYDKLIHDSISKAEQASYFLVFQTLQRKDQLKIHEQIDSVKRVYGLMPIEFSNQLIENVLKERN